MKFELFFKLYKEAKTKSFDEFVSGHEKDTELNKIHDNVVLLLRFIHEVAGMGIKEIREYLGMLRPQFCEQYEIKLRTLEDWEYGKNPVPERLLMLLSYTLVIDFMS